MGELHAGARRAAMIGGRTLLGLALSAALASCGRSPPEEPGPRLDKGSAPAGPQPASQKAAPEAVPAPEPPGPRLGKYRITSYGAVGAPPLHLGSVELRAGGAYEVFLAGGRSTGTGRYHFDPAKGAVVWDTGPYVGQFGGEFTIEREGKTHKIRLKRTTIATNSLD